MRWFQWLGNFHVGIVMPVILLLIWGFTILSSVSSDLLLVQGIAAVIGLVMFGLVSLIDYRLWPQFARILFVVCNLLLVLTILLGTLSRGSVRWLVFAGISIQPSEIVRPWLIVSFAALAAHYKRVDWRYLVSSIIVLGIPVGILLLQPDLGSAILLSLGWLGVSLAMKPSVKQIGVGIMASLIVLPLIWLTLQPYQKSRITGFINPHSDPQGIGYNVLQSQLAVGSGQLLGRGLGRGPQSHLQFLPERHTDFIFASLAEELGFVGSMVTLAIYGWLFAFLVLAQRLASDQFATYTLSGIFISLFGQFFINVGMNLGLMPVTGVTLPLLSYGGSSIIATCMTLGLVNAMVMQRTSSEATMRIR